MSFVSHVSLIQERRFEIRQNSTRVHASERSFWVKITEARGVGEIPVCSNEMPVDSDVFYALPRVDHACYVMAHRIRIASNE